MTHVSKITISRLYNLGNYEHIRYEISVDVPAGESAANAAKDLYEILQDLRPNSVSAFTANNAQRTLERPELAADADQTTRMRDLEDRSLARKVFQKWVDEQDRQARARKALDAVGGSIRYHDAKMDWNDE